MEGPIPDITEEELKTVYSFCKMLPTLEKMGRVRKSRVTRATCQRLIVVIAPLMPPKKSASNKNPLI
uniref:Uncharacterized protein n=1 Tax=Panagrolaimus sp. ES5 TaxID=591445 RepID=A0AC34FML2_9BILA